MNSPPHAIPIHIQNPIPNFSQKEERLKNVRLKNAAAKRKRPYKYGIKLITYRNKQRYDLKRGWGRSITGYPYIWNPFLVKE